MPESKMQFLEIEERVSGTKNNIYNFGVRLAAKFAPASLWKKVSDWEQKNGKLLYEFEEVAYFSGPSRPIGLGPERTSSYSMNREKLEALRDFRLSNPNPRIPLEDPYFLFPLSLDEAEKALDAFDLNQAKDKPLSLDITGN